MRRKRRRKSTEHVNESWLIPYSDLMTLLLALFIAMFSMSIIDAQKYAEMSGHMTQLLTGEQKVVIVPDENGGGGEGIVGKGNKTEKGDKGDKGGSEKTGGNISGETEVNTLERLKEKLDNYIVTNNLGGSLKTSLSGEGLMLTLTSEVFFDPGKADVKGSSIYIAEQVGKMLEGPIKRSIVVSGHTDNVPIGSSKYKSNWDLSVARAVNFMEIMLKSSSLTEDQFSVKGYGEFRPIATNDTLEGRQKNRRVEVLVIPNVNE